MVVEHEPVSLGILGRYYSVRHALGHYRSDCVTASYSFVRPKDSHSHGDLSTHLRSFLEWSLQATIRQHDALLYGISNEKKGLISPYRQAVKIDREDVMDIVVSQPEASESAPDVVLTQTLERLHTGLWPPGKPAWKVVFLEHFDESDGPCIRLDIAFLAHHAIADGMSGISFHTSLMENFQNVSRFHEPPPWPMIFPHRRPSPKQVEEFIDTLSCTCEVCNGSSGDNELIWGGNVISSSSPTDFKSRVRLVTIHPEKLSGLLRGCKQSKITLTGLLHGLVCASLCHGVKEAPGFRGVTPFAVRNHTKASSRDIVNHVSFLTSFVPGTKLQEIRESTPHSAAEEQLIVQLAESIGREIATTVKQFPHGCMTTKISRIENLEAHCGGQEGKGRSCTYELSNLGSVSSIPIFPHEGLKLEKLVFTQCGMVVGPALSFNCASVRDGQFTMSITWEEGIVEESLVEYLARDLQQRLENGIHRH